LPALLGFKQCLSNGVSAPLKCKLKLIEIQNVTKTFSYKSTQLADTIKVKESLLSPHTERMGPIRNENHTNLRGIPL